jgi:hypothetical protein
MVTLDGSARVQLLYSVGNASAGFGVQFLNAANQVNPCRFSTITSSDSIVDMTPGGTSTLEHSTFSSGAASGFFVTGIGNLVYTDLVNTGTAIALDPAIGVITVSDWKPYAEAGAGPAPSLATVRGTSCFDSASFLVTNGFVQATGNIATAIGTDSGVAIPIAGVFNIFGGPGVTTIAAANDIYIRSVEWTDTSGPLAVTVDSGSFDLATGTLTLPVAPAQGEECRFFSINSPTVIQASGTQVIQIGNIVSSAGGTATGTDTGDSLILTYHLSNDRWCSVATNGNWSLA